MISKRIYVDMRLNKCIYFPNPLSVSGLCIEPHPPTYTANSMQFSKAVTCRYMHIYIYAHKPKRMCAYEKKSVCPTLIPTNIIQYLSAMSNILTFSVSKNESLPVHNGLGCT